MIYWPSREPESLCGIFWGAYGAVAYVPATYVTQHDVLEMSFAMRQCTDKVAAVTGGSRGIGRSTALALGQAGARVVVTCVHQRQAADGVVQQLHAMGSEGYVYQFDIADFAATTAAFDDMHKRLGGSTFW